MPPKPASCWTPPVIKNRPVPERRTSDNSLFRSPWLYTLLWALVIFLLCNLHLETSGDIAWYYFDGIDKMVHGGMFFVLGFLSNWGFYRQRKRPFLSRHAAWFALLLCIVYGGIIEEIGRASCGERMCK